VRAAAETFRANPKLGTESVLTQLGVGEALVSLLDEQGQPTVVERAFVVPPRSQIGPIPPGVRQQIMGASLVAGVYEQVVDRESAYERLKAAHAQAQPATPAPVNPPAGRGAAPTPAPQGTPSGGGIMESLFGGGNRRSDSVMTSMTKSVARSVGSSVGRELARGLLGSLFGGRRR
jgi:hypothetical protein